MSQLFSLNQITVQRNATPWNPSDVPGRIKTIIEETISTPLNERRINYYTDDQLPSVPAVGPFLRPTVSEKAINTNLPVYTVQYCNYEILSEIIIFSKKSLILLE